MNNPAKQKLAAGGTIVALSVNLPSAALVEMLAWLPLFSMMSSSPHAGHGVEGKPLPSIQNAGQSPRPAGSLRRASTRPGAALILPRVVSFADVYRHAP